MSLVECPNCKQQVSDTRKNCIHCGAMLSPIPENEIVKEQEQKTLRKFNQLKNNEQDDLWKEFYQKYPKYYRLTKFMNDYKDLNSTSLWDYIISMVLALSGALLYTYEKINSELSFNILMAIALCALAKALLVTLFSVVYKLLCKTTLNHKRLVVLKRFEKWVLTEKSILYTPTFEESLTDFLFSKKHFDDINLDSELY